MGGGLLGLVDAGVGLGQGGLGRHRRARASGLAVNEFLRFARLRDGLGPGVGGDFVDRDHVGIGLDHLAVARAGLLQRSLGGGFGGVVAGAVQPGLGLAQVGQAVGDEFLVDRQADGFVDLGALLVPHRLHVGVQGGQGAVFGRSAGVGVVQHFDGRFDSRVAPRKGQRCHVVDAALLRAQGVEQVQGLGGFAVEAARALAVGVQGQIGLGLGLQLAGALDGAGQLALIGLFEGGSGAEGGFLGLGGAGVLRGPFAHAGQRALAGPGGAGGGAAFFVGNPTGEQGLAGGLFALAFDLLQHGDAGK